MVHWYLHLLLSCFFGVEICFYLLWEKNVLNMFYLSYFFNHSCLFNKYFSISSRFYRKSMTYFCLFTKIIILFFFWKQKSFWSVQIQYIPSLELGNKTVDSYARAYYWIPSHNFTLNICGWCSNTLFLIIKQARKGFRPISASQIF